MTNPDILILKSLILSKDYYNKYISYININLYKEIYKELYKLYTSLISIHTKNPDFAGFTSVKEFGIYFFSQFPAMRGEEQELFSKLFDEMESMDVSGVVLEEVLESHRTRSEASELAEMAWEVSKGKKTLQELSERFQGISERIKVGDDDEDWKKLLVPMDIQSLLENSYNVPGLKWKLKTLRTMMGSLRKGDFGFVFARPEVGKTTFLAHMGGYFASQMAAPYVHFSNEESGSRIALRYVQASLGLTSKELSGILEQDRNNPKYSIPNNINIIDSASIDRRQVERVLDRLQPEFIVLDSIDKIKGFDGDRDDLVYKKIYSWAREISKSFGPVIGVCHAAASAEGKKWLEMDDVAYAKTAKQGESDWILGIGKSYESESENLRYFHLPKNKLMGDDDMDEKARHGKYPVLILPEISQYEDII